ncbi:hypothetical protein EJ07DRAFT_169627 [Lizonia empirigonia]|nr:hypothetical protein EJ07DRAFT_169627 [Lizonia empirigonia]
MPAASLDAARWTASEVVLLDIGERLARDSWSNSDFQDLIAGFPAETRQDAESLLAHVEDLTRRDVKAVYLKQLQAWKASGRTLAIFSSGSVQAQLQFFSFVEDGATTQDVKPFFSAHYDTVNAGPKLEKASYEKICREMGIDASKVTFLTDNVKEAEAATAARLYAIVVDRPGNAPLSAESRATYPVITSLASLSALS